MQNNVPREKASEDRDTDVDGSWRTEGEYCEKTRKRNRAAYDPMAACAASRIETAEHGWAEKRGDRGGKQHVAALH